MSRSLPLTALAALLVVSVVACSKPPEPRAAPEHVASPLDPLLEKKQRAKDVQKTVDDQAKAQRAAIDAAEQ
jgi:hypothetical protein